ncbi:MAG: hypothetical protein WBA22_11190 [Candidatus Methanofastidiosia archaeon]
MDTGDPARSETTSRKSGIGRGALEKKYNTRISEELELRTYLKYTASQNIPFLTLYRFEEAFSFPLVSKLLHRLKATHKDYVLDPFCGSGTTLFTCFCSQIPSVGIDRLPVAWFVSKTLPLFLFLERREISRTWNAVRSSIDDAAPALIADDVPVMKAGFTEENLLKLRKMKTAIDNLENPYSDIFLVLFFSILEECSLTVKEHRYPVVKADKKGNDPIQAMSRKVCATEKDISQNTFLDVRRAYLPEVFLHDTKDSTVPLKKPPTILITSPPYADRIDYVRRYILELCFHFVRNKEELEKLGQQLLRSHLGSPVGKQESPLHPAVAELVDALHENQCSDRRIADMVAAYFVDMNEVIQSWYTILDTPARIALVVDNVQYDNVMIPMDLILSDLAEVAGFSVDKIVVVNYKRNHDTLLRESILFWEKKD